MPDDPILDPSGDPPTGRKKTCEFCGCQLSQEGEIVRMGEQARKYEKLSRDLSDAEEKINLLNTTVEEQRKKIAELSAAHSESPKSKTFFG